MPTNPKDDEIELPGRNFNLSLKNTTTMWTSVRTLVTVDSGGRVGGHSIPFCH